MDYESLNKGQRRIYAETVTGTHHRRVELEILTLNDRRVRSLTNRFLGGQVDTDVTRTPAAVLTCEVYDDDFVLDWQHGAHRKFKARVIDSRFIPGIDGGTWVDVVVFTGPLWDFERTGSVVSLAAQGTERLAMGSVRRVFTRPRKARATVVIRELLTAAGAVPSILVIPRSKVTLPERVTVGVRKKDKNPKDKKKPPKRRIFRSSSEDTYYGEASRIAAAIDRLLYVDSRGRFVVRSHPRRPVATLTERHLTAPVTEKRSVDNDMVNTWEIVGANPKGPKKQVRAEVGFPKRNTLSAQALEWHNKPHELIETVENKHLKTKKQAVTLGKRLRDRALGSQIEYTVEALPCLPWLQPHMIVSVPTSGGRVKLRATRWTLPLGPDASSMTLGANKRTGR